MSTTIHMGSGSFLPRPRAPSSTSDQDDFLSRHSSNTYTVSSRQSSCASIPTRPIPPTPRRMMSPPRPSPGPQCAQKRRKSGIPRPTSGSSRPRSSSRRVAVPFEPTASKRISVIGRSIQPPSSWRPTEISNHFESSYPDSQPRQDLSVPTRQQQHQIRHHSTPSHPRASKIDSPQTGRGGRLTRSPMVPVFLSPGRDITPRRRLMKPLSPPLPKNQSIGSASCFNSLLSTPSPSKINKNSHPAIIDTATSQVDVIGALQESRMTDEDIAILNQVQKEANENRRRLKTSISARQRKSTPPTLFPPLTAFTKKSSSAKMTPPVNLLANSKRVDDRRSEGKPGRSLFINTSLANAHTLCSDSPDPEITNHPLSSGPEDDWEINLKLVHFSEPLAYWTGRYMSISSRLRQAEMNEPKAASPSSTRSSELAIEPSGVRRMNTALKELRSCCRTTQALQSLETFETELKRSLRLTSSMSSSAVNSAIDVDNEGEMMMLKTQKETQQLSSSPQQMLTRRNASTFSTPTKLEPSLPNIWSRLALPKSKTTSNLLNLQSSSTSRLSTPMPRQPNPGEWLSSHHARRSSRSRPTSDRKGEVLKDFRQLVKTPGRIVQQRMSSAPRKLSYSSNVRSKSEGKALVSSQTMPQLRKSSTTTPMIETAWVSKLNEFDKVSGNLTSAGLETGRQPPALPPAKTPVIMVETSNIGKVLESRRRSQRKSSGEIIKGVFDAGMKQVKQIGKRVGGSMSWVGSQEDLHINVLATGTR